MMYGGDSFKQTIQDDSIHEIGHENGVIVLCQKRLSRPKKFIHTQGGLFTYRLKQLAGNLSQLIRLIAV